MQSLKKRSWILAVAVALAAGFIAGNVTAEPQGHMTAALASLQTAKNQLQKATTDKGGHRAKALNLVNQAIVEVQAGIAFDNKK